MSLMSLALAFHACRREAWRENGQIFTHIFFSHALKLEMSALPLFVVKMQKTCEVDLVELNGKSCAVVLLRYVDLSGSQSITVQ